MNNNINGVINVYKEKGFTSHDVVAKLRGILKTKKIGHTGTLDPEAEGVLPICIGNATKLCDLIMEKRKTYEAELVLSLKTDTQDMTGEVIEKYNGAIELSEEEIINAIKSFEGDYAQIPPMYSALKVNGRKLYDLAREGIEVERKPRNIYIYGIDILEINLPVIRIRVNCSKGTYIRTLCNDIGDKLGVYGCMGYLLRTQTGIFKLTDSVKLSEIEQIVADDRLEASGILIKTEDILDYPKLNVKERFKKLLLNGNVLTSEMFMETDKDADNTDGIAAQIRNETRDDANNQLLYRVYCEGRFYAVYKIDKESRLYKPEKMFMA
ncbi:MAG: tRNA pseudouridine(55) synthase TruB [Lachnospiraceae bacterium]|nr:tRNA pseudouridine(55) synthase TruB [Lachnospiraceae bacterium]